MTLATAVTLVAPIAGCPSDPKSLEDCRAGCQAWEDECNADGLHCEFYCEDDSQVSGVASCTGPLVNGGLVFDTEEVCSLVDACFESRGLLNHEAIQDPHAYLDSCMHSCVIWARDCDLNVADCTPCCIDYMHAANITECAALLAEGAIGSECGVAHRCTDACPEP